MGSLDYKWEYASANCKKYETIFLTIKQMKASSEDRRKKQHVYLEHLGRQGWGRTACDHKQINHQQKKRETREFGLEHFPK